MTAAVEHADVRFIIGNALDVLRAMPRGSVNCLLSSPPYLTLRDYLPPDHPMKAFEIGLEATPGEYLESLLNVMDAAWPVLTDDGTFWIVLGDTHAGSASANGDGSDRRETVPRSPDTQRKARRSASYRNRVFDGGPLRDRAVDEDLGITPRRLRTRRTLPGFPRDQAVLWLPSLFGASLAYGRNLLTGAEHQQWVTRPAVTWCKPSVTPGREGRKFRTATELVVYGGKHQRHYFDLDSVREKTAAGNSRAGHQAPKYRNVPGQRPRKHNRGSDGRRLDSHPDGAPPFNWWEIATVPYPEAHFATFPKDLCIRPVIAGCPLGGVVLDPFAGTGTALAVASGHGRRAIGIDLDERNAHLARARVGMFLTVETFAP